MTEWQDLDREYGEHDLANNRYVVRRRQRRQRPDGEWEYRWRELGSEP